MRSNRAPALDCEVVVKAFIPSWWMVMRCTGVIRFMLPGIGMPRAQLDLEMTSRLLGMVDVDGTGLG